MKGGYQILDLRNIGLELKNTTQSITNVEILNQLRPLRNHIEKGHSYAKGLDNALKCVMIRYRDAKTNEKTEVCEFADIISTNSSLTFEIKGKEIMIEVVFEEKTDDDGNKYYDIKTAKYLYNKNEVIDGNLTIGGTLNVGDDASFDEDLQVNGDLGVVGDANINGDISVGETSKVKVFENIVDKNNHNRFIEGDITIETITGITQKYGKWSLSGSHLLIVLAVDIANATSLGVKLAEVELPEWIKSKIIPLYSTRVAYKVEYAFADDNSQQQITYLVDKTANGLSIYPYGTITADRHARFQLDLLIDNESEE